MHPKHKSILSMMNMKYCIMNCLIIVTGLLVSSCAKLPIVSSKWHNEAMDVKNNFSNYDVKSGLRYMISNDETHLYVSFDTDNQGIQKNIMMSGARISIDTNGKKKGTAYLKYPLIDLSDIPVERREGNSRQASRGSRNPGNDAEGMMKGPGNKIPMKAVFVTGNEQYYFDNRIEKTDFETVMIRDSMDVLYCMVGIPFNKIHPGGIDGITSLSVGIEIEGSQMPGGMPSGGRNSGMQMSAGGSRGGGMPGGGRASGGMPGGSSGQSRQMPDIAGPVKIWMAVQLVE